MSKRLQRIWSSVKVKSCADGSMNVEPKWIGIKEYTPEDGGGPGLLTRLAAAQSFERAINKMLRDK